MPRKKAVTVGDHVARYLSYLETQGSPDATVKAWKSYLLRFASWAGDEPLDSLTLDDLDDFISETFGRNGYSSRKGAIIALRAFYRWADTRGHANFAIAQALSFPHKPKRGTPTFYKPEQVAAILGQFEDCSDRIAAMLLARHGQRISSTLALKWKDVDLGEAVIRYPATKTTPPMVLAFDKETGRQLAAWKALTRWSDDLDWVFVSKRSRSDHRQDDRFRVVLREACRRCGVPYRGAHEFRRTLATTLLTNGVPLHAVSRRVLGHSNVQTTLDHYAGVDDLSVADALRKLPF